MIKKAIAEKDCLTLLCEGRVDSSNAPDFQKELEKECEKHSFATLLLDLGKVEYVSSAGLRVFLSLEKKLEGENKKLSLVNASPALMEIFEMTGFNEILDIRQAYRPFSIAGLEMIGSGLCGEVYRVDQETILKLYRPRKDIAMILKEKDNAKKAFVLGIPTAISYDIVQVGDRLGILFELLKAKDLISTMKADPDHVETYAVMFAQLAKKVHSIDGAGSKLPRKLDDYWDFYARSTWLTPEEKVTVKAMLEALPDATTLIHGDFHPGNSMLTSEGLMFIDMGDVSLGSPYNDLAQIYSFYYRDEPKGLIESVTKIDSDHRHRFYKAFIEEYFNHPSPEELAQHEKTIRQFVAIRNLIYTINFPEMAAEDQKIVREGIAEFRASKSPAN
jgi:uncharacterized protein (TIGR02172 family)